MNALRTASAVCLSAVFAHSLFGSAGAQEQRTAPLQVNALLRGLSRVADSTAAKADQAGLNEEAGLWRKWSTLFVKEAEAVPSDQTAYAYLGKQIEAHDRTLNSPGNTDSARLRILRIFRTFLQGLQDSVASNVRPIPVRFPREMVTQFLTSSGRNPSPPGSAYTPVTSTPSGDQTIPRVGYASGGDSAYAPSNNPGGYDRPERRPDDGGRIRFDNPRPSSDRPSNGLEPSRQVDENRVAIIGEVGRPGTYAYTGSHTLTEVLRAVGGITKDADSGKVIVRRGYLIDPSRSEQITCDLKKIGETRAPDIDIRPGDIVEVTKKRGGSIFGGIKLPPILQNPGGLLLPLFGVATGLPIR